jgi:transcription initiation factor TFIIIB Brf1 subunit/transcription initiation factor TFIIB
VSWKKESDFINLWTSELEALIFDLALPEEVLLQTRRLLTKTADAGFVGVSHYSGIYVALSCFWVACKLCGQHVPLSTLLHTPLAKGLSEGKINRTTEKLLGQLGLLVCSKCGAKPEPNEKVCRVCNSYNTIRLVPLPSRRLGDNLSLKEQQQLRVHRLLEKYRRAKIHQKKLMTVEVARNHKVGLKRETLPAPKDLPGQETHTPSSLRALISTLKTNNEPQIPHAVSEVMSRLKHVPVSFASKVALAYLALALNETSLGSSAIVAAVVYAVARINSIPITLKGSAEAAGASEESVKQALRSVESTLHTCAGCGLNQLDGEITIWDHSKSSWLCGDCTS